ncbi:hypothetical protein BJV82DRAFT_633604 [Fennellomyces sp. T-0311]|nr:hypothetical protein BJV82DRAFT_633604 [Fennellomyces sp. T-0311]
MNVYVPFQDQKKTDATLTLKAMGTQLGINLGISLLVMAGFSFLRPRHTLVYAPKYKFSKPDQRPPAIGTGWLSWVKPVLQADDEFLMDRIGFDAVLLLRFIRLIRRLLIVMSIIGICALIPVNIVATYHTGDWPPPAGLDLLSISGINYISSSEDDVAADTRWYWSPAAATWIFSILIAYFAYRASCDYIEMRQRYFRHPPNALSARSLLISNVPKDHRTDEKLKSWMDTMRLPYTVQQAIIGLHSSKLTSLTEEHEAAVRHLEDALSTYLNDGKSVDKKKRPTMRVGGFLFCGGKKVDEIDYYTEQVKELEGEIKKLRKNSSSKISNYGWVSFDRIEHAHTVNQAFNQKVDKKQQREFGVRLSPAPKDLIWANLPMEEKARKTRRWIGRLIYWILIFVWMIPIGALSATSNVVNLIRLFPNSEEFINNNSFLMGIIQAWFTPIVMALFFLLLPHLLRFLSKQQGYQTHTTLDRKVFIKLFVFFIINNLLVFTLASIFIGIYGQIRSLILSGSLDQSQTSISDYITQLAKNISDVSTFWINYVCIKALGLTMEMAQVVPLLLITLRKWITRPSPRELRDVAQPPEFDYPLCYNMLLFFFTIALLYSAIAPLVLPFALLFFVVSTMVYKYMLMYIFVTKTESGGRMWPTVFVCMMASTVLFQVLMIIVLNLKGGHVQSYVLIPLPVFTIVFGYFYSRRMETLGSFIIGTATGSAPILPPPKKEQKDEKLDKEDDLSKQFQDPGLHKKLMTPMVHEDVKHLLPQVYHRAESSMQEGIEMMRNRMDLDQHNGFDHRDSRRLTMIELDDGNPIKFCTVAENEALEDSDSSTDDESTPLNRSRDALDTHHRYYDDDQHSQQGLMTNNHMDMAWRYRSNNDPLPAEEHRRSINSRSSSSDTSSDDGVRRTVTLVTKVMADDDIIRQYDQSSMAGSSMYYSDNEDDDMNSMAVQVVIPRRHSALEQRISRPWAPPVLLRRYTSMPELLPVEPPRKSKKEEPAVPVRRRNSAPWFSEQQQPEQVSQLRRNRTMPPRRRRVSSLSSHHDDSNGEAQDEVEDEQPAPLRPLSRAISSRLSRSTSLQTGGRSSWYYTAERSDGSRPPSSLLVRTRTVPGRQSISSSTANSRYRITYYDDLLDDSVPSLPEFGQRESFTSSFGLDNYFHRDHTPN